MGPGVGVGEGPGVAPGLDGGSTCVDPLGTEPPEPPPRRRAESYQQDRGAARIEVGIVRAGLGGRCGRVDHGRAAIVVRGLFRLVLAGPPPGPGSVPDRGVGGVGGISETRGVAGRCVRLLRWHGGLRHEIRRASAQNGGAVVSSCRPGRAMTKTRQDGNGSDSNLYRNHLRCWKPMTRSSVGSSFTRGYRLHHEVLLGSSRAMDYCRGWLCREGP